MVMIRKNGNTTFSGCKLRAGCSAQAARSWSLTAGCPSSASLSSTSPSLLLYHQMSLSNIFFPKYINDILCISPRISLSVSPRQRSMPSLDRLLIVHGAWSKRFLSHLLLILVESLMKIQGVFFNWCPPKNSKCQPVSKFWHLELFWWDLLCNLTLRTFRGAPVKKNTLYL